MDEITDPGRRKQRDRRSGQRRIAEGAPKPDRRDKSGAPGHEPQALVVVGPAGPNQAGPSANKATSSAAFAAQLLGQPGAKRGLKGGAPVLEGARAAYLESEYLGKGERRTRKGVIAKTEI
jgi:hypothetical protein